MILGGKPRIPQYGSEWFTIINLTRICTCTGSRCVVRRSLGGPAGTRLRELRTWGARLLEQGDAEWGAEQGRAIADALKARGLIVAKVARGSARFAADVSDPADVARLKTAFERDLKIGPIRV